MPNDLIGERPVLEVDMELYGDRMVVDGPTTTQAPADAAAGALKPIAVALDAQDIGRMAAENYSPYMFNQEILARLKHAGAPVEGSIRLKLAHGAVARVKPDLNRGAVFQYIWLDEAYVEGMHAFARKQKAMGF
jgi:hypothetical protein